MPARPIKPRRVVATTAGRRLPPPAVRGCDTRPVSQRPRSTSAQRGLQNGRVAAAAGLPQIGQRSDIAVSLIMSPPSPSLSPAATGPLRRIRARPARRARSASAAGSASSARDHGGRGAQRRHPAGLCRDLARRSRRSAARPAACGPASSSCSGGWMRGRTISARPSAVKPSKRGLQRIVRQRLGEGRAQRRAPARRQAGEIDQDRAGQVAQPDLPRQRRQHGAVDRQMAAALPPPPAAAPPRSTSIAVSAGVGWIDSRAPLGRPTSGSASASICASHRVVERPEPCDQDSACPSAAKRRVAAGRTSQSTPPATGRRARSSGGGASSVRRRIGIARGQLRQRSGPRRSRATGPCAVSAASSRQPRGQPRPLAALRGAGDPHAQHRALGRGLAALAVGQEAVRAVQRHERARHRRHARGDPAAVQIADTVRRAWPPDRVVQQLVAADDRDAHLARAARRQDARRHGTQPAGAAQQLRGLEQRQADHVGVAAGQEAHERGGAALDRVAAGLAAAIRRRRGRRRSAARSAGRRRRRWRPGARCAGRPARAAPRRSTRDGGGRTAASGSARASASVCRLGQDAPAGGDHGVGGQHETAGRRPPPPPWRAPGAARRAAAARRAQRRFVDVGGNDAIRHDADLRQQGQPPRAGRGQDQRCAVHATRPPGAWTT